MYFLRTRLMSLKNVQENLELDLKDEELSDKDESEEMEQNERHVVKKSTSIKKM